jgi:hypothetical protein
MDVPRARKNSNIPKDYRLFSRCLQEAGFNALCEYDFRHRGVGAIGAARNFSKPAEQVEHYAK